MKYWGAFLFLNNWYTINMTIESKDFKVKNGLIVGGSGDFSGPVSISETTLASHAARKDYVDSLFQSVGLGTLDGGNPFTTEWAEGSIDAGMP